MTLFITLFVTFFLSINAFANDCIAITQDNLCIELYWPQGPKLGEFSSNVVRFKDLNQSSDIQPVYISPAVTVTFYGWMIMGHHEHGTREVLTQEIAPGVFENTKIFYMQGMHGTWQFKVKVGNEDFVLHSLDV
jgi:hypothetical protein